MKNKHFLTLKSELLPLTLILLSFLGAFYFYSVFPNTVPTQWSSNGDVNNVSSKEFAAWFMPIITAILYAVFLMLPRIDPKSKNYPNFITPYHIIKNSVVLLLSLIYLIVSLAAIGEIQNPATWIIVLVGILIATLGSQLDKLKQNWFIGIRTPWTLANEKVWQQTHILGKKIFTTGGVILAILPLAANKEELFFLVLISIIVVMALIPVIYSFAISKKH